MKRRTPSVFELQRTFLKDRPEMKRANQNHWDHFELLKREVQEAEDELYSFNDKMEEYAEEIVDIAIFCISILEMLGKDSEAEIRNKIGINASKYSARQFDGKTGFKEARRASRNYWTERNMKALVR